MTTKVCLMVLYAAALLSACAATTGDADEGRLLRVTLKASPQAAGSIAQANFVVQGEDTDLNLDLGALPSWISRPVNLFTYIYPGSCANPGAEPAYSLNSTLLASRLGAGWHLSKIIPVPLSTLRSGNYALVVRTTAWDRNLDIFCGDIQ